MALNPIDHRIMFEIPELQAPSHWIEHVPFAMLLIDLVRPRSIVELGVYAGVSYCAFCQAVSHLQITTSCYAIGSWHGDTSGWREGDEVLERLKQHHDPRYGAFSQLMESKFNDAERMFSDGTIDLLHIGGQLTYEAVSHDFTTWLPKMSDRCIVLLDDISERHGDVGVRSFWEELAQQYLTFEFQHGHGLGLVCVGSQIPEGIQQLLDCTDKQKDTLRTLCHERGEQLRVIQQVLGGPDSSIHAQAGSAQKSLNRATYESQILALGKRTRELSIRLNGLAWTESSRGVKAIKLARATRNLLQQKGPVYAARRISMWLSGKRGIGVSVGSPKAARDQSVTQPSTVPTSPSLPTGALIRDQRLPTSKLFSGVSVIIPVFNSLECTQRCVTSIYNVASQMPFEIVVIDNGSDDNALAWLRNESQRRDNFWYISLSNNVGYARGINLGVKQARGQYYMLANSDILATPYWLDSLVNIMESQQDIGVLSPLTNHVGHGPQSDPMAENLRPEDCDKYAEMIAQSVEVQIVTNPLTFFCVMVRKQVTSLLGGLDEGYASGNYADDDFCMRARLAGYTLAVAKNSFVYHSDRQTFTTNTNDDNGFMRQSLLRYLDMMSTMSCLLSPRTPRRTVTQPMVSVILRTVDRPKTLRLALTSLANQMLDKFEVVVVCDGGPDIQQLLADFSPYLSIHYVHNTDPKGRSETLNTGVSLAQGTYITYLDDDDIVYPTHLETLLNTVMEGAPGTTFAYVDYNRALVTSVSGKITTVSRAAIDTWDFNYDHLLAQNFLPIHTWLHDRKVWEEVGGFATDLDLLEDWDFLIRVAQRRKLLGARQVTCEYRSYLEGTNSLFTNPSRALAATQEIFTRYPASEAVAAHRSDLLVALRDQVASSKRIRDSLEVDGQVPEPLMPLLIAELTGFVV